ncbi:MAG: L-threonylcarbamoyladenylate synthase, partial [Anaerolineales bacterium]
MDTKVIKAGDPKSVETAASVIMSGGLVAFPTDTVYGLGASAFDGEAIERIYQAKRRDESKAIPILLADGYALDQVAEVPDEAARKLAEIFWPGPLTLVLPKAQGLPEQVSSEPTVGVRVPDHEFALKLLTRVGPMAVSSANRSGASTARTAREVLAQLSGQIELVVDGGISPGGRASTVATFEERGLVILREGPLK